MRLLDNNLHVIDEKEDGDLDKIRIQFTLFSAFCSPLISAMSGGFLKAEGLDPEWSIAHLGVEYNGLLKRRYRYEEVCAPPPAWSIGRQ